MTKTRRKKRLLKKLEEKKQLKEYLQRMKQEGQKLGFKTAEEYLLWEVLKDEGIEAAHNVEIYGIEVDFYIKPNLVIEVGFLDDNLKKAWSMLEEKGYQVLYFANLEIRDRTLLHNIPENIKEILKKITAESASL